MNAHAGTDFKCFDAKQTVKHEIWKRLFKSSQIVSIKPGHSKEVHYYQCLTEFVVFIFCFRETPTSMLRSRLCSCHISPDLCHNLSSSKRIRNTDMRSGS